MSKFLVVVTQTSEFEVEVEAPNEHDAISLVRDFDGDELDEYESSVYWDYVVVGRK